MRLELLVALLPDGDVRLRVELRLRLVAEREDVLPERGGALVAERARAEARTSSPPLPWPWPWPWPWSWPLPWLGSGRGRCRGGGR